MRIIRSLFFGVNVIADNCTDPTAGLAREAGTGSSSDLTK